MAKDKHEAKRNAVVQRLEEIQENIVVLSGMWDEKTLDQLILIFGLGRVELND